MASHTDILETFCCAEPLLGRRLDTGVSCDNEWCSSHDHEFADGNANLWDKDVHFMRDEEKIDGEMLKSMVYYKRVTKVR